MMNKQFGNLVRLLLGEIEKKQQLQFQLHSVAKNSVILTIIINKENFYSFSLVWTILSTPKPARDPSSSNAIMYLKRTGDNCFRNFLIIFIKRLDFFGLIFRFRIIGDSFIAIFNPCNRIQIIVSARDHIRAHLALLLTVTATRTYCKSGC